MPQMNIPFPRVTIISPQQEPIHIYPRMLAPPVFHTIPPEPVTPLRVNRGPKPQRPPYYKYNTRGKQRIQQSSTNFLAAITDKLILKPDSLQLEISVINYETGITQKYKHLIKRPDKDIWITSFASELGRLSQGVGECITASTEMFFLLQVSGPQITNSHVWPNCCISTTYEGRNTSRLPNCGGQFN